MHKSKIKLLFLLLVVYFIFPRPAKAVIPPDFIFNIGSSIAQFFSIILIFFTAILGAFFQFFKARLYGLKHKKIIFISTISSIIIISLGASYFYAKYKQKSEYQKWLNESQQSNTAQNNFELDDTEKDENDQLSIGSENNQNIDTSEESFVSLVKLNDSSSLFINEYYKNIAEGNLERAYAMSKKSVNFSTFKSWYLKTTKITLDKLVHIDAEKSSIELTLYEGNDFTRYGVLMTLSLQNEKPVQVSKSEVKILAQGSIEDKNVSLNENEILQEYTFFNSNEDKSLVISNQDFKKITNSQQDDYLVLDARENIEYENGYFPESLHIRFADIKAGRWIELPKNKFIYVICWSGIRGKEVAEFLRTKKIVASYLENGANGWVEFGGKWVGSIKFGEKYTDARYQIVFDTNEIKNKVKQGVFLVDSREPSKFKQWHIAGSVNIPIMYTPTIKLEEAFNQVSVNSQVITVCDGYVNCFDAKVTGVELERRGHQFLGRYNKPWEYEK